MLIGFCLKVFSPPRGRWFQGSDSERGNRASCCICLPVSVVQDVLIPSPRLSLTHILISQNASLVCKCFHKTGWFWFVSFFCVCVVTFLIKGDVAWSQDNCSWTLFVEAYKYMCVYLHPRTWHLFLRLGKITTSFNITFEWFCSSSGWRTGALAPVVWLLCYFGRDSPLRCVLWLWTQWGPLTELAVFEPQGQYCPDAPL